MQNISFRILLIVLFGLCAGSCQPTSTPIATQATSDTALVEELTSSPTVVIHTPTLMVSVTELSAPTPAPELAPGWCVYPQAGKVKVLSFDMHGNLLAGSTEGLLRIQPDGVSEALPVPDEMLENEITSIAVTPDEVVWVGTWGGGVWRYDGKSWQNFTTADGMLTSCLLTRPEEHRLHPERGW